MTGLRKFVLLALALAFAPAMAAAQGVNISGRVTSEAGEALPGVSVFVEGLNVGSTTDDGGRYSFSVPEGRVRGQTVTLTARRIGFTVRTAQVTLTAGSITQNFVLAANPLRLGEVVVTGQGTTTTREKLGNVINTVDSTAISRSNESNVVQALAGKAPNIEVNQQSGEPGASSYIRIRGAKSISGTGQPLFVVDGVPIDNSTFATGPSTAGTVSPNRASDINPADIASVEILKGSAAAAIYGARAAQGVVLITTKSGVQGPTRYSFRSNLGWSEVSHAIPLQTTYGHGFLGLGGSFDDCFLRNAKDCVTTPFSWGLKLDRDTYLAAYRARLTQLGRDPNTAEAELNRIYPKGFRTYDHFDELFDSGFDSDLTASASGGSDRTTFYLSVGRLDQNGIITGPNNTYDRSTARLKATHRLRDRLSIGGNMAYTDARGAFIQKGSNLSGLLLGSMRTPPNYDNTAYLDSLGQHRSWRFPNPAFASVARSRIYDNPFFVANKVPNKSELSRVIGDVNVNYDPMDWLAVRYSFGGDYYTDWRLEALPLGSGSYGAGRVIRADLINYSLNHNLTATATKTFSDNLGGTLTLGQNLNSRRYRQTYVQGFGLIAPEPYAIQNTTTWEPSEYRSLVHTESYFGQGTLDLFQQLYLTAAVRNDGFSTFGESERRHWFPKVSGAWVFTNAIGNRDQRGLLSFGKLRLAYGETGKEPGVYTTIPTTLTVGGSFGGGWGDYLNAAQKGLGALYTGRSLGNTDIKPERTKEVEGGIDLGLFDQRADIGLTFYNSKSTDVILFAPRAPSTGFLGALENAAEISNKGVEATLNVRPITRDNFSWDFGINYAKNRNEVLDLKGAEFVDKSAGTFSGSYGSVTKGSEVGVIRGEDFVRCGRGLSVNGIEIDKTANHCLGAPAGAMYIGDDGYPVYDETDRVIANPNPRWTGSFRTAMTFARKWTVSALVDHKHGGDIWNGTKGAIYYFGTHKDTEVRDVDRIFGTNFMPGNPTGTGVVAGPGAGTAVDIGVLSWYAGNIGSGFTGPSAQFIEDGTYTKLREVSVAYTMDAPFLRRILGFNSVDLRLAGRNLATWTDYTGIDPETNLGGAEVFVQGIDYFNNPQTRTWVLSIGLNR
jgi:TonB-linked SusC/RagA family outer membrane protein